MKKKWYPVILTILAMGHDLPAAKAQSRTIIDVAGTYIYGLFNDTTVSPAVSRIYPVKLSNGVTATLPMGNDPSAANCTFVVPSPTLLDNTSRTSHIVYGSAAMAAQGGTTNIFYLFTDMGPNDVGNKDLYVFDPNPSSGAYSLVKIGTTPASLQGYRITKMAISPTGFGYALAVNQWDTSSATGDTRLLSFTLKSSKPLTSFTAVITDLGTLSCPGYPEWDLYGGDIAFDNSVGNMYFVSSAYSPSTGYGASRLFAIPIHDIPSRAGTTINMIYQKELTSLNGMETTGIAFSGAGDLLISARNPSGSTLYRLISQTSTPPVILSGGSSFSPTNYSVSDLAGAVYTTSYFVVLEELSLQLSSRMSGNNVVLSWAETAPGKADHFEIQRSIADPSHFAFLKTIPADRGTQSADTWSDNIENISGDLFYRVVETATSSSQVSSNIIR